MKTARLLIPYFVIFSILGIYVHGAENKETATLFPGDSHTFKGVTVSWIVSEEDIATTGDDLKVVGRLKITGPKTKIESLEPPLVVDKDRNIQKQRKEKYAVFEDGRQMLKERWVRGSGFYLLLVDDVLIQVFVQGKKLGIDGRLELRMESYSHEREFSGAPSRTSTNSFSTYGILSSYSPLEMNQWRFTLSEKPVSYPDGSEFHQIAGFNAKTGEKLTMPATKGAIKEFGRFQLTVREYFSPSRTVTMFVVAGTDRTIRGKDAFAQISLSKGETYGEFFQRLGKEYGFQVGWAENPKGYPDSIEYAKNMRFERDFKYVASSVNERMDMRSVLNKLVASRVIRVNQEWTSSTLLRVSAVGYQKIVDEREKETAERERIARLHEEQAFEKQRFLKIFEEKYKAQTQIYRTNNISAQTAKELVEPELGTYHLLPFALMDSPAVSGKRTKIWRLTEEEIEQGLGFTVLEKGEHYYIARQPRDPVQTKADPLENPLVRMMLRGGVARTRETAIADPRTNSLILTAIPATFAKVEGIVEKMDGALGRGDTAVSVQRFRIEVALLQGWKNGAVSNGKPDTVAAGFRMDGAVEEILVEPGNHVEKNQAIARLDASEFNAELESNRVDADLGKAKVERDKNVLGSTRKLFEAGRATEREVLDAELALKESQALLTQAELKLKLADKKEYLTLQAPAAGIVTAILANARQAVKAGEPIALILPDKPPKRKTNGEKPDEPEGGRFGDPMSEGEQLFHPSNAEFDWGGASHALDDIAMDRDEKGVLVLNVEYVPIPIFKTNDHPDMAALKTKARRLSDSIKPLVAGMSFQLSAVSYDERIDKLLVRFSEIPFQNSNGLAGAASEKKKADLAAKYGISRRDLDLFGIQTLKELGTGMVYLIGEKGESGAAAVTFPMGQTCVLEYQNLREPFLIVKSRLSVSGEAGLKVLGSKKDLLESTVFLEKDKPTILGVTNLNEALILTLRWQSGREVFH